MALIYPNIVPEDNSRLPDALTIEHGPAPLLSRFVLEGDKFARDCGIRLRVRNDFDELVDLNRRETATGNWFPMVDMFNPEYAELVPENSYWISGENQYGDIVLTGAFKICFWPNTTLEDEARMLFSGRHGHPQTFRITAPAAKLITGVVVWGGSLWIHPSHRRRHLSHVVGRLGRALAVARWPVDWMICVVMPKLVESGAAFGYGYKHLSPGLSFPDTPLGDLELTLAYLSAEEAYDDFASFLATELAGSEDVEESAGSLDKRLENVVTSTSLESVFQGSSNRS